MKPSTMNKVSAGKLLSIELFLFCWPIFAQVSSIPPQKWTSATPIGLGPEIFRVELSHNTLQRLRQELLDTNTIRLLAKSGGLNEEDLATFQISPWPDSGGK